MKCYRGCRTDGGVLVSVNGAPLDPRFDLWNHSPTGFEWGYGGSGPAQLALAILADHLGDADEAVALHQDFKRTVVAGLAYDGWELNGRQIDEALRAIRAEATQAGGPQ